MLLVPLLYSKVSIQRCAVMIDFTCLHSHDAFYLRTTSLDVLGLGRLIRLSLNHSCGVALLVSGDVADTKPSL